MMTPEARETLLGACDKFAGTRGKDGLLKALRILTGEEIRVVVAGRLAELEATS